MDSKRSADDQIMAAVTEGLDDAVIEQLIDNIAIPAFVINQHHVVTHWNRALETLSGCRAGTIVGSSNHWQAFYSHRRPTMADLIVAGNLERGVDDFYRDKYHPSQLLEGAFVAEDFFPDLGDRGEWLAFTASPLHDSAGAIVGAIETLTPITERKQAEQRLIASEQRYRELSSLDELTRLFNVRHFNMEISSELERARRYRQPLAMAMLDLDHFKRLNDTWGHQFGDQVLEGVGTCVRGMLRAVDSAYRYGGEEFAVLMPQADLNGAMIAMERINQALAAERFQTPAGDSISITASVGVAAAGSDESAKSLIGRADKALYRAKADGRNRVRGCDIGGVFTGTDL
ncbi:GGDEF domain-containing protein [Motiliproteus sediminis]|uniref:GGDEF domain-containing protein n=1 Tax=Motiliproteus sediminis TaxID=1468178 RepID=UPI001AF011D3|nr:sensor domain-containing diguanylate cyclase [Motiliproteus sediminis]